MTQLCIGSSWLAIDWESGDDFSSHNIKLMPSICDCCSEEYCKETNNIKTFEHLWWGSSSSWLVADNFFALRRCSIPLDTVHTAQDRVSWQHVAHVAAKHGHAVIVLWQHRHVSIGWRGRHLQLIIVTHVPLLSFPPLKSGKNKLQRKC